MKKSTQRVILRTLMVLFLAPFTCCGLGYSFLFFAAPVTWTYETDSEISSDEHLEFGVYIRGSGDYYMEESGPRRIKLSVERDSPKTQITVRLLKVEAVASESGLIKSHLSDELPVDLPFTAGSERFRYQTWALWSGIEFDIEPSSEEIITITMTIEVQSSDGSSKHITLVTVFKPIRYHRPIWYFMPTA